MVRIALICEGVSENKIIGHVVQRFLVSECLVNAIQPKLKEASRGLAQASGGGWSEVLNHCTDDVIANALSFNDYVVIQIDTDAFCQSQFGVPTLDSCGKPLADSDLYAAVCKRLLRDISPAYYEKIIFAVCFNETECWLLPLYYTDKTCRSANNCIYRLNVQLKKKNIGAIPEKEKNNANAIRTYNKILREIKKKQTVQKISQYNYGFMRFVEQLGEIKTDE